MGSAAGGGRGGEAGARAAAREVRKAGGTREQAKRAADGARGGGRVFVSKTGTAVKVTIRRARQE